MKRHYCTMFLILGVLFVVPSTNAINSTWLGDTGNWNDGTQWDTNPSFPNGVTDNATITSGAATLNLSVTLNQFTLSGGSIDGSFNLTLGGLMTWNGGQMSGSGTTVANGGLAIDGVVFLDTRTLRVSGGSTQTNGYLCAYNGAIVTNVAGATFSIQDDSGLECADATLINLGKLVKMGAGGNVSGVGEGVSRINWTVNNSGTLQVNVGTLSFEFGTGVSSGTITAAPSACVSFAENFTVDGPVRAPGHVEVWNGQVDFNGLYSAGTTVIGGGLANFNSASATTAVLNVQGGEMSGPANVIVTGPMTWKGISILSGSGTTTATSGLAIDVGGYWLQLAGSRTLQVVGTCTLTNGWVSGVGSSVMNVPAGSTLYIQDDSGFGDSGALLNNAGLVVKSGAGNGVTGTPGFSQFSWVLNNTGTLQVNAGTLSFVYSPGITNYTDGVLSGGAWRVVGTNTTAVLDFAAFTPITTNAAVVELAGPNALIPAIDPIIANHGTFRVSNGKVFSTTGDLMNRGTLAVEGAGSAFFAKNNLVNNGAISVSGGTLTTGLDLTLGETANTTGTVVVAGSGLVVSNVVNVGNLGAGQITVSNGAVRLVLLYLGRFTGSAGTLTVAGGTVTCSHSAGPLTLGLNANSRGTIWVTGGTLVSTNGSSLIGRSGIGQMTLSNGQVRATILTVGQYGTAVGTVNLLGGTNTVTSALTIGEMTSSTGSVWLAGGRLVTTGATTTIGSSGIGQLIVSNGTWQASTAAVAPASGSRGILNVAGGVASVFTSLVQGNSPCNSTGTITVNGGSLYVTNATVNAVLDVLSGTLTLNSGVLSIDKLVMTNACGRFVRTGGTLLIGTKVLGGALDADNDGLPNGWEETSGLDPLDPGGINGPNGDPDTDGFTNAQEYQAGTNPMSATSFFQIRTITAEGNNIRVGWLAGGGRTNVVQAATGGYTTNLATISPNIIIPGSGDVLTNYLDVGGATNVPLRLYRVRVVP